MADKSLQFFLDIEKLGVDILNLMKKGSSLDMISEVSATMQIAIAIVVLKDAKNVLPELKDLSEGEACKVGKAAYRAIKAIVDAV